MIFAALASWLIARAKRTPYFHLHHADGTLYMERYWLVPYRSQIVGPDNIGCYTAKWYRQPVTWLLQRLGIAARVQLICTPDTGRDKHDHPWPFISMVLFGFYCERTPCDEPTELDNFNFRRQGSIVYRSTTFRHRISSVSHGGVWTLFITFRRQQRWGFFTSRGWVPSRDYIQNNEEPK